MVRETINLITIIISLLLGYWQGIKKRRRKANKEIESLKEENKTLEKRIKDLQQRNTLEQYSSYHIRNGNKDKFLQDLVSYYTKGNEEANEIKMVSNLVYKVAPSKVEKARKIYLDESINRYKSTLVNNSSDYNNLLKEYNTVRKVLFNEINIDKYDINFRELIESIEYVINQF